jgi:hypothetical protein
MADADPPDVFPAFGFSVPSRSRVTNVIESALTCAFSRPKHNGKSNMTRLTPPCYRLVPIWPPNGVVVMKLDSVHLFFSCHWDAGQEISSYVSSVISRRGTAWRSR